MKIVADENITRLMVSRLRAEGHTIRFILEEARGINDQKILPLAAKDGAAAAGHASTDDAEGHGGGDQRRVRRSWPRAGAVLRHPVRRRRGADQLRVHPETLATTLYRAFEHVADVQFAADLPHVNGFALEGEGRVAGDYERAADAGQI